MRDKKDRRRKQERSGERGETRKLSVCCSVQHSKPGQAITREKLVLPGKSGISYET